MSHAQYNLVISRNPITRRTCLRYRIITGVTVFALSLREILGGVFTREKPSLPKLRNLPENTSSLGSLMNPTETIAVPITKNSRPFLSAPLPEALFPFPWLSAL